MKKLIIALVVVAVAVVANAAACNWSGNGVVLSSSKGAASAVTGYSLYLIDVNTTSVADMTAALQKNDTSLLAGAELTTSGIAVGTTAARWSLASGSYAVGSYTMYTVILNNSASSYDQYMITKTVTANAPSSGNLQMSFGSQSGNSWNNVPEPTSAMLLLLGVAGLALRRKQK